MNSSLHTWLGACTSEQDYELPIVPLDVYTAASIGNCASISQALELSPTCLNLHNKGGWTALMYASYYGHHDAIMLLTSRGASVHSRTHTGYTALMLATMCGHSKVVAALIKSGSLLEVRDSNTWTAVFHAVHSRQSTVLQLLLESGANANACEHRKGESPLLAACREGDQTMVEALLRHGADPGLPDYANNTPGSVELAGQHRFIADIIAKSVATRGIISGLTDGSAFEDQLIFSSSDGASLQRLLSEAGLVEHYPKLVEQAVNLQVFLTLTDSDLKECGISKLGPRRKMTALIGRWHSNAPLRSAREAAYADRLEVEKQELALKLSQANKELRALGKKVHQEQELQLCTESLVVEARGRLQRCHNTSLQLAGTLTRLYRTVLHANDSPSDPLTHRAGSLHCAAAKTYPCFESTLVEKTDVCEEFQSQGHESHSAGSQGKALENGNVKPLQTRQAVVENPASVSNIIRRGSSNNTGAAATASSAASKRSHSGNGINGVASNDARWKRHNNGVDANIANDDKSDKRSSNPLANEEVFRSDHMLPLDGTAGNPSACKFWSENEIGADKLDAKNESVLPRTVSSVILRPDGRVLGKAREHKLIDSQTDTSVRLTRESFYLNNVDNVILFNIDNEHVSASQEIGTQKGGSSSADTSSLRSTLCVELDANSLISDLSQLDLNSVPLPSDYMTRPPRLCVPKLGGPLKECLEMVQELVELSDPNVPRTRAPDAVPVNYRGSDEGGAAVMDDDCTTTTDETAKDYSRRDPAHENCILVSSAISSDNSVTVVSDSVPTCDTRNKNYGCAGWKTNCASLNYRVNTQTNLNSNDSISDDSHYGNLTDAEKLKPLICTDKSNGIIIGESEMIPNKVIQRTSLFPVTRHPLAEEQTPDEQISVPQDKLSAPLRIEVVDDLHNKANLAIDRRGQVGTGNAKVLHRETKGLLHKSKKDRTRVNVTRPFQNHKRKCEFISTADATYSNMPVR